MDAFIRRVGPEPTSRVRPLRPSRRQRDQGEPEFELEPHGDVPRRPPPDESEPDEDKPVAARGDDEAGSHLDVTA